MLSMPLTHVKEPVSGYFFQRKKVLNISFDPGGYKTLLKILVKSSYKKVKEIPYTFKTREIGKSKLDFWRIYQLPELYHLYGFKLKRILHGR